MKASVQYNDYIGTAAADISDHTNLKKFIASRGIDPERYYPIGASFYAGYDSLTGSIICIDNEKSTEAKKHIVEISFEKSFDKDEFFNLFKRFHVMVSAKHSGFQDHDIDEEITIDDRAEEEE